MNQEPEIDMNRVQLEGHYKRHTERTYIGSHDLMKDDGSYTTCKMTIDGVFARQIYDPKKRKTKTQMVISFKGTDKDFIANATNQAMIEKVSGKVLAQEWVGVQIVIGVEDVKVGRETKKGLRVKPSTGG